MKKVRIKKRVAVESSTQLSPFKRIIRDHFSRIGGRISKKDILRKPIKSSKTTKSRLMETSQPDPANQIFGQDNFPLGTFWC